MFREGGVEASVVLAIEETAFENEVKLRFVPRIDRLTGNAQLELDGARIAGVPFDLDLSGLIPPVRLPRSVRWDLEMPGARALTVDCYVQGIGIQADRLRIELGLVASD